MQKIAILTDSASDISLELMKEYDIRLTPFRIIYSYGEFEDKITITPEEVYEALPKEIPTTSLPSTEKIEKMLQELEADGYTHVISINLSSKFSGTGNSIRLLLEDHPKLTYYIYDTKTLTMAEGAIVLEAAKMVRAGKSFEEIIEALPKFREKVDCYFTLNTLEYLKKGGRIGKIAGTVGELINIKPIIWVGDDGVYHTHSKIRGRKQALSKLEKILTDYMEKYNCKYNLWILHGGSPQDCETFYNTVKDFPNIENIHTGQIGPALGVHTGPGLIGFIIQRI